MGYVGPPDRQQNSPASDRGGPAMPKPGASDSGDQAVNLRFQSYWDVYDPAFVAEHMVAGAAPGHACEYETSTMLHLFPERVSIEDIDQTRPEQYANCNRNANFLHKITLFSAVFLVLSAFSIETSEKRLHSFRSSQYVSALRFHTASISFMKS